MQRIPLVIVLFATALWLVLSTCQKDKPVVDYKYEYFPLKIGHWVIYDVDSIKYNDAFTPPRVDTVVYQIKEVIESTFRDNAGRESYRIERYRRDNDSAIWEIRDVWVATLETTQAERVEDNLRFIKLVFPITKRKSWKGNVYINATDDLTFYRDWEYVYEEVDVPLVINGLYFDSTLTVLQHDAENMIQKIYGREQYAKHVGLISMDRIFLERDVGGDWKKGFILRMRIKDYAK